MKTVTFFASFLLLYFSLYSQTFTNQTSWLNAPLNGYHSGVCMAIADMNGDGLDDLIHLDNGTDLWISFQNNTHTGFNHYFYGIVGTPWSIAIADVDHNGFNDIMLGGYQDNVKVYKTLTPGSNMLRMDMPGNVFFLQGSNFVDIDNNGWLDIFACNDIGDSRKYRNIGSGTFVEDSALIYTLQDPVVEEMNSGNYASVWTDYDNDGDLDMYLSKCRSGVLDATDIRRVNRLFRQEANGSFTEVASLAGLASGEQSWSSDFADIDNDGDIDAFVVNHTGANDLYENNGNGTFTKITTGSGLTFSSGFYGIQALFRDVDNDGFVDLLVAGNEHYYFRNNGDTDNDKIGEKTFTKMANPFGSAQMESFAVGDLNKDGFLDVFGGYANFFNSPSLNPDQLFIHDGNSNNHFCVTLQGVASNRNGIGARVELWGIWGKQIREVRSGESYGISNSLTQHFGIGAANAIDSLIIHWPSGQKSISVNPTPNEFVTIVEGTSLPVEWLSFDATQLPATVQLAWTTSREENNDYFVIERSNNNKPFEFLGMLLSQGNSATPQGYQYVDEQPLPGVNSYRIAQVDLDGKMSYSKRVEVTFEESKTPVSKIYPNPADGHIQTSLRADHPDTWYIKILDIRGSIVWEEVRQIEIGIHSLAFSVDHFAPGLYSLQIIGEDGELRMMQNFAVQ